MWSDVIQKKFPHKLVRGQIILKDCPFCGNDKFNIELSTEKAVFHCWICDASGTVKKFFDHIELPMVDDGFKISPATVLKTLDTLSLANYYPIEWSKAEIFLKGRGLEEADISGYNLMTTDSGKFKGKLIIPLYEGGTLAYIVARDLQKKGRYYNVNINRSGVLPYYLSRIDTPCIYLCEGIFDAISVNKIGFTSAVMLGTVLSKEQMRKLERWKFTEVVVCLDGDAQEKAFKMYDMLKKYGFNAHIVMMHSADDPNDVYVRDRAELKWLLKHPVTLTVGDRVRLKLK